MLRLEIKIFQAEKKARSPQPVTSSAVVKTNFQTRSCHNIKKTTKNSIQLSKTQSRAK